MRSYKQYCGVARALDLVGSRWALLILRDLLPGPRRFSELKRPGLTPNVLSQRLSELSDAGLIHAITLPPPASRKVWALTDQGQRIRPVVLALGEFGFPFLRDTPEATKDIRFLMVSLERRYQGGLSPCTIQLVVGGLPFQLRVGDGLRAVDGVHPEPDVTVSGPVSAVIPALTGGPSDSTAFTVAGEASLWLQLCQALAPLPLEPPA